ncbi:MAG TPA: serine hydrolase [bacterium]|nr:serine hydrolase [bacterium]
MERNYWPTADWRQANPETLGMNSDKLAELENAIKSRHGNINAFIIVKKGFMVYEQYFNGFNNEDVHNVASVAKSFISALIGIAIDLGLIKSADQKIIDFFPEYKTGPDDIVKRAVTIKHMLTMTAPIASKTSGNRWEALDRLRRQKDWIKYIFEQLGRNGQFGKFQYSTAGTHLLSAIITRTAGMNAREFANRYLFKPLGMAEIPEISMKSFSLEDVFGKNVSGWINDPQGNTAGGWGLAIKANDMARFGFLYLNKGFWNDKRIISEKWIEESIAMNSNKYGYLWWLIEYEDKTAYTAAGSGGSHIYCLPDEDMVVVIASKIILKPRDRWELMKKYVLAY